MGITFPFSGYRKFPFGEYQANHFKNQKYLVAPLIKVFDRYHF